MSALLVHVKWTKLYIVTIIGILMAESKNIFDICWSHLGVHLLRNVQSPGRELIFCMFKNQSKRHKVCI